MNAESKRRFPKITDQALDALRSRINMPIENTLEPWCHEATRDNIRHYAHGIGDDNPLWCDPAYAAKTQYGGIVALPSFLFATSRIVSGYVGGISGVHAMWAGSDWTWHKPVLRNQEIRTEAWLKDLIEHQTRFAGRAVQQIYHVNFFNPDGDLVAEADSWCFRTDRDQAREEGTKYSELRSRPPHIYTDADLQRVYKLYEAEEVRGSRKAGRGSRRGAADHGQGADDGDGLHCLRPGLGRPVYTREQAGLAPSQPPSRPRHPEPLRHPGLPRARALGTGFRPDGRRAGGLRLRPGTLLLADTPPDELDGR
jgi:acyl dehydratase